MKVAKSKQATEKRKAYSKEQIACLYAELTENYSGLVKKDDRKWETLLAMFTGAQLREVARLVPSDIRSEDVIWYIDINADGEKKNFKSPAANRRVPIHSELIRLGFLEWMEGCAKQPHLFTSFTHNTKDGYGRNLGRWFRTILIKIGIKEYGLVFHSLRHTAITRMRQPICATTYMLKSGLVIPLVRTRLQPDLRGLSGECIDSITSDGSGSTGRSAIDQVYGRLS
ncbi:MAG: site-specific integrase [Jannaschia sp.]